MADALEVPRKVGTITSVEQSDRRKDLRIGVNLDGEIEEPNAHAKVNGRVTDLGLGGCYVDVMTVFPVGTPVLARISREGQLFQVEAEVKYSKQGLGMGLAFSKLTQEQQLLLMGWAVELSGGTFGEVKAATVGTRLASGGEVEPGVLHKLIKILTHKGILSHSESDQVLRELKKLTQKD